eukprot:7823960-Pyramimonas_sp.AAC.1
MKKSSDIPRNPPSFMSTELHVLAFPTAEAGARALAAHWSQVHASVSSQIAARDQLEEHIQKVREAQIWRLSEEQFYGVLDRLHDSAPGPDGL